MKIFKLFLLTMLFLNYGNLQGQTCKNQLDEVTKAYKSNDLPKAFELYSEAIKTCDKAAFKSISSKNYEAYYKNLYNYGKNISFQLLKEAKNKQDSVKYSNAIIDLYDKWAKDEEETPENYLAEKLYYQLTFEQLNQKDFHDEFEHLLKTDDTPLIASRTLNSALYNSVKLYNSKEITASEMMNFYTLVNNAFEYNVQYKGLKFQEYLQKEDSTALTANEKQYMDFLGKEITYYEKYADDANSRLTPLMTCDIVTERYSADYENYKDSLERLGEVYRLMRRKIEADSVDSKCNEESLAFLDKLDKRIDEFFVEAIERGDTTISPIERAQYLASKAYHAKNWSEAVKQYKEVYNLSEGSKKGDPAYYIADIYNSKLRNKLSAIDWGLKAASAGNAYGYQLVGSIYANTDINSCGSNNTQKLSLYLVAADYFRKAGRMSSRTNGESIARQYEAAGPTREDMFNNGMKPGQRISITCLRGGSTTLR